MFTGTIGIFLAVASLISGLSKNLEKKKKKVELQCRFFSGYVEAAFAIAVRF